MADWREWHRRFVDLLNGDISNRNQRLFSLFTPRIITSKIATQVSTDFKSLNWSSENDELTTQQVDVSAYTGSNPSVERIASILEKDPGIFATIIHGSLGSLEEVSYSDFDALVIVKDETICNPEQLSLLATKLTMCRREMFRIDPVQHHGWFALPELALKCWPEDYLPIKTLETASVIGGIEDLALQAKTLSQGNLMKQHFKSVSTSIRNEIASQSYRRSVYHTKSMLSKLMLLPCLYLQAKSGKGCDKKSSFVEAKKEFNENEWIAIETASQIRTVWSKPKFGSPQRFFATNTRLIGDFVRKRCSPKTPVEILNKINDQFHQQTISLIASMNNKIEMVIEQPGVRA